MHTGPHIRAVIFDMDGVLTDSEPLINAAAVAMFREKGLAVQPSDFLPFVGAGEDRYLGGVAEKYGLQVDIAEAKRRTYEIYLGLVPEKLEAFPGAVDLVLRCKQAGLRVAVASSADRVKVDANLERIGLPASQWDAVITGEEVTAKKPAPDIFLAAAARLGTTPGECVVIEDAVNGVMAAQAAGMKCVAVAQTFPAAQLVSADLVRPVMRAVELDDLISWESPTQPPVLAVTSPDRERWQSAGTPLAARRPGTRNSISPATDEGPSALTTPPLLEAPATARIWGPWASLGLGGLIFFAWTAAQGVVYVVGMAVHGRFAGQQTLASLESDGLLLAVATLVGAPVAAGLCWLFAGLRRGIDTRKYLGLHWPSARAVFLSTVSLLVLLGLSDVLTLALGRPLVPEVMVDAYATARVAALFWLAIVCGAPLAEEFLFRGFVFEGLRQSGLGGTGTILLTSLVWAGIHLQYDWYGIGSVFVTGLMLGYIRLRTGSVVLTMVLHGLMNLIATVEVVFILHFRN